MNRKDFREAITKVAEFRSYATEFHVRSAGANSVVVTGYASTVNQPYTMHDFMGEYQETVRGGAFAKTLSEGADVALLLNHGGATMARTKSGSLVLSEDSHGLLSEATLNTQRSDVADMVMAIQDGDITEMSFGFRIVRQSWNEDYTDRELTELNLNKGDVSAVNYGANPNTNIGMERAAMIAGSQRMHQIRDALLGDTLTDADRASLIRFMDYGTVTDLSRIGEPDPAVVAGRMAALNLLRNKIIDE